MAEKKIVCESCEKEIEISKIKIFRKEVSVAGVKVNDILYGVCPECGEEIYLTAENKGVLPTGDVGGPKT